VQQNGALHPYYDAAALRTSTVHAWGLRLLTNSSTETEGTNGRRNEWQSLSMKSFVFNTDSRLSAQIFWSAPYYLRKG